MEYYGCNCFFSILCGPWFAIKPNDSRVQSLVYSIDSGIWILILLHVFYAHRKLGTYVVMIGKMVWLVLIFLIVIDWLFIASFFNNFLLCCSLLSISIDSILMPSKFEQYYRNSLVSEYEHENSVKTFFYLFTILKFSRNKCSIPGSELYFVLK